MLKTFVNILRVLNDNVRVWRNAFNLAFMYPCHYFGIFTDVRKIKVIGFLTSIFRGTFLISIHLFEKEIDTNPVTSQRIKQLQYNITKATPSVLLSVLRSSVFNLYLKNRVSQG